MFNAEIETKRCIQWIKDWFKENAEPNSLAVIGLSGGKDSTIAAKLCVEALGEDRVYGVIMPNGIGESALKDKEAGINVAKYLNIRYTICDIGDAFCGIDKNIEFVLSTQAEINLPARLRMCMLYAVSQTIGGRVVNTCNKSEDWVGYATLYGDAAGDFSPLSNLLVREVKAIGYELGIPDRFIEKIPADGLCGKNDEENLGFSYNMLDSYIGDGAIIPTEIKNKIDELHKKNLFKTRNHHIDSYQPIINHKNK